MTLPLKTYTAKRELFFSTTPTDRQSVVDYNWHWYDGTGLRAVTHVGSGGGYVPTSPPTPTSGSRSYYVYDGSDVALILVKNATGTWWVRQRYGEQPLALDRHRPLAVLFESAAEV